MSSSSFPPPPRALPGTATPFALTPGRDDTALFQDSRAGFSHLLPGRPMLGMAMQRPGDPPADALIHLQDAPITIRYRLEPPSFAASSAGDLARGTAERYASWRAQAQGRVAVDWANDSWLVAWGVEAAAVSAYDISGSDGALMREDLFVLLRQGMVMLAAWTYPRGFVDDPAYATFASVAEATMTWDPSRWEQRGRVWPEGPFLGAGLFGVPGLKYSESAKLLAAAPIVAEERAHVLAVLSGVVSAAGAPWMPLTPDVIESHKRTILATVRNTRLRAFVDDAFVDVKTAHDLRGLAIILGRALDVRRTSAPPPMLPGTLGIMRPPAPAARVSF